MSMDFYNVVEILPDDLRFLREKSQAYISEKRIPHVDGCTVQAISLAKQYGISVHLAAEAAILHDITKRLSDEEQLQLCREYGILDDGVLKVPQILHAFTGAVFAEREFNVGPEVSNAIRFHSTGRPYMTTLEKIIYIADLIEPSRTYSGVEIFREALKSGLDNTMLVSLKHTIGRVKHKNLPLYSGTLDCLSYFESITNGGK